MTDNADPSPTLDDLVAQLPYAPRVVLYYSQSHLDRLTGILGEDKMEKRTHRPATVYLLARTEDENGEPRLLVGEREVVAGFGVPKYMITAVNPADFSLTPADG